jgi:hypothetical protein
MEKDQLQPNPPHSFLAELEAHRTGEPAEGLSEEFLNSPAAKAAAEELDAIATVFQRARPVADDIPEAVDHKIRAYMDRRARAVRRHRKIMPFSLPPAWAAAAAAAVVAVVVLWQTGMGPKAPVPPSPPTARIVPYSPKDIDRNGIVDMVDAYLMARQVKSGKMVPADWDVNGDGAVDQKDIGEIARTAVAIETGGA